MKVYTHNKFFGVQPTGTAAVIVANNTKEAIDLLNTELKKVDLAPTAEEKDLVLIKTSQPTVLILCDGDY